MIEKTILAAMLNSDEYVRKVLPFLKNEYFDDATEKFLYEAIRTYIDEYNHKLRFTIHGF